MGARQSKAPSAAAPASPPSVPALGPALVRQLAAARASDDSGAAELDTLVKAAWSEGYAHATEAGAVRLREAQRQWAVDKRAEAEAEAKHAQEHFKELAPTVPLRRAATAQATLPCQAEERKVLECYAAEDRPGGDVLKCHDVVAAFSRCAELSTRAALAARKK